MDLCTFLDWDSSFFGIRIARVNRNTLTDENAHAINTWCKDNRIDCLYLLADSDNRATIRTAEKNCYALVDIRVTLSQNATGVRNTPSTDSETSVSFFSREDLPYLREIARRSHTDSRFYRDGNFPRQLCDSLYETWIAQSCEGYAQLVFSAYLDDIPVGYVTCHVDEDSSIQHGRIGLLGVHQSARGRGVGHDLVDHALRWFADQGIDHVDVVTQGHNIAAQRLYQKSQFRSSSVQCWYHKWYTKPNWFHKEQRGHYESPS